MPVISPISDSNDISFGLTRAEQVFHKIQEAIVNGLIAPGSKISEQDLADTYGISRGPLREAINRLEGQKLLVRIPHVGTRVVSLSMEELFELYEIRESLEGMACRLAAQKMSTEEIENLFILLQKHEEDPKYQASNQYYIQNGDFDFHYRIIQGSGNLMLIKLLCDDLYHLIRMCRIQYSKRPNRPQLAMNEHRRIVEAIANRDGELAELLMKRHIASAKTVLSQCFSDTYLDKKGAI